MKTCLGRIIGLGFIFILAAASTTQKAEATVIDFNNIPDGTPVSVGNPYAGILVMESGTRWIDHKQWPPIYSPDNEWVELPALISYGRLSTSVGDRTIVKPPWVPPLAFYPDWLDTYLNATFLEPVTDVSFTGWTFRGAIYNYTGVNGNGETFTGEGTFERGLPEGGSRIELGLPDGYYLSKFSVAAGYLGGGYDFWIDDIAFTPVGVPDSGSSAVLLGLGFVGVLSVSHLRRLVKV